MTVTSDLVTTIGSCEAQMFAQNRRILKLFACVAALMFGIVARADELVLLGSDSLLPISWSERGIPRGYAIDLAREALKRAGFQVRVELTPWARAVAAAKSGGGIISNLPKSSELEPDFMFSQPTFADRVIVVVKKGNEFPFESVRDLAGKRVGVLQGATYGNDWNAALESFHQDADEHAESRLKKLLLNRIDAAIVNSGYVGFRLAAERARLDPSAFTILPNPLIIELNCIGIVKGPGSADKLRRIDAAIETMNRDGITRRIVEKYGEHL